MSTLIPGLFHLFRREDTEESESAAIILADTIMLVRKYIFAQLNVKPGSGPRARQRSKEDDDSLRGD